MGSLEVRSLRLDREEQTKITDQTHFFICRTTHPFRTSPEIGVRALLDIAAVVTRRVVSWCRKARVSRVEERRERQKRGQNLVKKINAAQQKRQKKQKMDLNGSDWFI